MFATACQCAALLFAAMARAAERRLGDFSAQGLANMAWAFATASQRDVPLFAILLRVALRRLHGLSAHPIDQDRQKIGFEIKE